MIVNVKRNICLHRAFKIRKNYIVSKLIWWNEIRNMYTRNLLTFVKYIYRTHSIYNILNIVQILKYSSTSALKCPLSQANFSRKINPSFCFFLTEIQFSNKNNDWMNMNQTKETLNIQMCQLFIGFRLCCACSIH